MRDAWQRKAREGLWVNLTTSRYGCGISFDWSVLTVFVSTCALVMQMRKAIRLTDLHDSCGS